MEFFNQNKSFVFKAFVIFVFVVLAGWSMQDEGGKNFGTDTNKNTITVTGAGEVYASPDIANISFSISKDAKTGKEAQTALAEVEKKALDFLAENKVDKNDIKSQSVSLYPKYEYQYTSKLVPCDQYNCPPNPGKNVLVGYTASENISVKLHDLDSTGKIVEGLGTAGVSDLNGPNFAIDKEDDLKAQARKDAINKAKDKASALASDLGVRLGKIISFNESGNYPIAYEGAYLKDSITSSAPAPAVIPKGQNTITSNVTIVYEIK